MAVSTELKEFKTKIEDAAQRISPYTRKTPLNKSSWLSEACGCEVFLKMESEQLTNSFKLRGATNFLVSKLEDSRINNSKNNKSAAFVAASSGNHGLACSNIMSRLGSPANLTVYVATSAAETKIKAIKRYGANVIIHGSDCVEAENEARRCSKENAATYVSPYNDLVVISGQGTIGKEVFDDLPSVDAVIVPVGGGGLISGIALYLKSVKPDVKVIGCQPENSCVMFQSIKAGKILDIESLDTLSDGTAGGIESGAVSLDSKFAG